MLILYDDLIETGTLTHSTEVTDWEAENAQAIQPSVAFRTTVLDPGYVQSALAGVGTFDLAAAIGTNATAHRCLIRQSNHLNTSPWSQVNVDVYEDETSDLPVGGLGTACNLVDTVDNDVHAIVQTWDTPTTGGLTHTPVLADCFVGVPSSQAIEECRLRWTDDAGNQVYVDFDLSAGTAGTPTTSGSSAPTGAIAGISPVAALVGSSTWYRIWVYATPTREVASTYQTVFYLMDGLGNITYTGTGTDALNVSAVSLSLGTSLGTPEDTGAASGALYRIQDGSGELGDSDWAHATLFDKTHLDSLTIVHHFSASAHTDDPRLSIHDPYNADSYIQVGRFIAGPAISLACNLTNWQPDFETLHNTRMHQFTLQYLTRDEAMGEIHEMYRSLGSGPELRSRGGQRYRGSESKAGLFIADESETTYNQEMSIYGFLDGSRPIPNQIGPFWNATFTVLEAI